MLSVAYYCILTSFLTTIIAESVHWQWRELVCKSKGDKSLKDASKCELRLKETEDDPNARIVPLDVCFDETMNGQPRHYCNILCPGATTAYRITRFPQNHKTCFSHYTYRIERRGENFFMWRDGKCRTTDIQFTIRCEFSSPRAEFLSDDDLFAGIRKSLS
ncbi:unnamed protein product [Angiostrongylus costaricensis]|uniref:DUF7808 domain-containing protein n=1 Tax=Angiostrongylus costaricensis TaxID=334426 RepID=A0A0R3PSP3_ANGCS|nr:unnamed protein product [Angiostrongylus costaricensis]